MTFSFFSLASSVPCHVSSARVFRNIDHFITHAPHSPIWAHASLSPWSDSSPSQSASSMRTRGLKCSTPAERQGWLVSQLCFLFVIITKTLELAEEFSENGFGLCCFVASTIEKLCFTEEMTSLVHTARNLLTPVTRVLLLTDNILVKRLIGDKVSHARQRQRSSVIGRDLEGGEMMLVFMSVIPGFKPTGPSKQFH